MELWVKRVTAEVFKILEVEMGTLYRMAKISDTEWVIADESFGSTLDLVSVGNFYVKTSEGNKFFANVSTLERYGYRNVEIHGAGV